MNRWERWAEAVTVWVFGELNVNTGQYVTTYSASEVGRVKPGELLGQMDRMTALLNGWH